MVDVLSHIMENTNLDDSQNAAPTHSDALRLRAALHQAAHDALARIQSAPPAADTPFSLDSSAPR